MKDFFLICMLCIIITLFIVMVSLMYWYIETLIESILRNYEINKKIKVGAIITKDSSIIGRIKNIRRTDRGILINFEFRDDNREEIYLLSDFKKYFF